MSVIWRRLKDIFTSGEGQYVNEHGEVVYGKLPRAKLEDPIKILTKPTAMSEFGVSTVMLYTGVRPECVYLTSCRLCVFFCRLDGLDSGWI